MLIGFSFRQDSNEYVNAFTEYDIAFTSFIGVTLH